MALTAVNFDIYLAEGSPGQYTARAILADGTGMTPQPMNLGPLLGSLALTALYQADQTPPANPTPFVAALLQMRQGFSGAQILATIGDGLLQALPSQVRDYYNQAWALVGGDRTKLLRVRLHFDKPELGTLPWEYLKVDDLFLCEHPRRSLIRYPESGQRLGQLDLSGPLKVLIWTANPTDTEPLDFQAEVDKITQGLQQKLGNQVEITVVRSGGPQDLLDTLESGRYHVWHYIGHGTFDSTLQEGVLLFEPTPGATRRPVRASQLRSGLIDHPTLRLVFLNSCKTAVGAVSNAYASLGLNLARFTPAVIAMQAAVGDDSAVLLANKFYRELSAGNPIDGSLTRARQALLVEYPDQLDWGIPALFTRAGLDTIVPDEVKSGTPTPVSTSSGSSSSTTAAGGTAATPSAPFDATLKRDLVDLLTQAFPSRSDLAQLTDFYLNVSLNAIPTDANDIRALAQGVVNWTQAQGGDALTRLIDGAIKERPARNDLKAMRARLVAAGLIAGSGSGNPSNSGTTGNTTAPSTNTPTTATNTPAPPAIPSVEPPPVATFSNGRLILTPQGRRTLAQTIANATWAGTAGGRDGLLANLPQGLKGGVSRSDVAQLHIGSIISTSESWGKMTGGQFAGKYALIVLADTGAELSGFGTDGAPPEAGIFMGLANAMRHRVGQPPAAMPFDN